jgi:hypothetical protein
MIRRSAFAFVTVMFLTGSIVSASAQSACGNVVLQGETWTAGEWNEFFSCLQRNKADYPLTTVPSSALMGVISPSLLPLPTASTIGGVKSVTGLTGQFMTGIDAYGNPTFGPIVTKGYSVSGLSAITSPATGMRAHVTDATTCVFGVTPTGGGSAFCPVVYNGAAWVGG